MDHEDDHFFKEMEGLPTLVSPPEDNQINYYSDFALTSQMKQLIKEKKDLQLRLFRFEERHYQYDCSQTQQRNKRQRRTANQISKYHKCVVPSCQKSYGSQGSLNQHIKLKHPQLITEEEEEEPLPQSKPQKENTSHNTERAARGK